LVNSVEINSHVVRTLADAITASLRSWTEALEHWSAIYEDRLDVKLTVFGFLTILLLPVRDSALEELLYVGSSLLIRKMKESEGLEGFLSANHIGHESHLARRAGHVFEPSAALLTAGFLDFVG
jgi:hypothetical protein